MVYTCEAATAEELLRHGSVARVAETKVAGDATDDELAIREVNAGVYAFEGGALKEALDRLTPENAQGELYLTTVLELLERVGAQPLDDPTLLLGVNDRADLARVRALAARRRSASAAPWAR